MNEIKIIRTEKDYQDALNLVKALIEVDPDPESTEGEQLSLLVSLIQSYEAKAFPSNLPDPIDAIKFRMEQADLKPADLVPYIGSPSRVSEILSGKRSLTIEMIRSLEAGLGIPAKILIQKSEKGTESPYHNWDDRLVKDMASRGYFGDVAINKIDKIELIKSFFTAVGEPTKIFALLRKSSYRASPLTDKNALSAWFAYVVKKAKKIKPIKKYKHGTVNLDFMKTVARLSVEENGPVLAQEYLKKYGIILVIESHFPKTYLDGAAILINKDNPIIGLTLRFNRLDNFWFTLMHELAHVGLHYEQDVTVFYDEIEGIKIPDIDDKEKEADKLAGEALVPANKWEVSPARLIPSVMAAKSLARELGVHIAIVAGKIRHEGGKYVYLSKIINEIDVRNIFLKDK
jgi:HTH-type transcriptional regulator/antitoxin HigA